MIRVGVVSDLEALVDGNLRMARETEDLELDIERLRGGVLAVLEGRARGAYRVLEEEGKIVGQLMLTYEWSDWRNAEVWWIQSVFVAPQARGQGVYRRLYEGVLEEARQAKAAGVRLYVDARNVKAQQVYEKLKMDGGHYKVFEAMF